MLVWEWEVGMVPPTGLCSAAGKWRFYKAASAEDADEEKRFMCVRTYAATPLSGGAGCPPLSRSHLQVYSMSLLETCLRLAQVHLLALAMGAFIRPVPSTEDGVPEINICNIHDGSAAFGQPEQRPQDGLWQNKCALDVLFGHPQDCLVLPLCTCGVTWLPAAFRTTIEPAPVLPELGILCVQSTACCPTPTFR